MELKTPQSLKKEHDELHAKLARAKEVAGATGTAAKSVAKVLHPHFLKEEEYALPQLGLLPVLAEGKISQEMEVAVAMSDRLKADLSHMLLEHKQIVAALEALIDAAKSEEKTEILPFAEELKLHAQNEEEILYPASILIGEYLKLKLSEKRDR